MPLFSNLALLCLTAITPLTAAEPLIIPRGSSGCSTFNLTGQPYTTPSNVTQIVSVGIVCPSTASNTSCNISASGYIHESASLNVSASSSTAKSLYSAVSKSINQQWTDSIVTKISDTGVYTFNLSPGSAGYVKFMSTLVCYDGVPGDCSGDAQALSGVGLRACEPKVGGGMLDGTFGFATTDAQTAANITTNPALNPPGNDGGESGAIRKSAGTWWCLYVAMSVAAVMVAL